MKTYHTWTGEGTIGEVHEDLGPSEKLTVHFDGGGTMEIDVADVGFDRATLEACRGRRIRLHQSAEILPEVSK